MLPSEARIITLRYFGSTGLSKLKDGRIRGAVRDACLLYNKQLKSARKDELAVILGSHLFAAGKVVKVEKDKNISYMNLAVNVLAE